MQRLNLILRVATEAGVVAGLAYWGVHTGGSPAAKLVLGIGAPLLGFGFWGAVDFHSAGRLGEPLRLLQELGISLVAALAWYAAGRHLLAIALAALTIVYHALVYASGEQLLTPRGRRVSAS